MSENFRLERIERLFKELQYEIHRGMMEREIDEHIQFSFIVPTSRLGNGYVVRCEFRSEPELMYYLDSEEVMGRRLRLVK